MEGLLELRGAEFWGFTNWQAVLQYIPGAFLLVGECPNPLELLINRRATLTLYHKITFSSLNLPHKDTLLPQVFFSETLFVHYASALFLQYPLRTIFRFHLLSSHTD